GEKFTVQMEMTIPAKNNSPYSFNNPLLAQPQVGIKQPLNKPSLDHVDLITGDITGVIPPEDPHYTRPANCDPVSNSHCQNVGGVAGAELVYNPSTKVAKQISATTMTRTPMANGATRLQFTTTFIASDKPMYIRARGTNIPNNTPNVSDSAGNPLLDSNNAKVACTDPACPSHLEKSNGQPMVTHDVQAYSNVWFYANPIFIRPEGSKPLLVETNRDLAKNLANQAAN